MGPRRRLGGKPFRNSATCVLASLPQRRPFSVSSPQTSFVSHQHRSGTGLGNCRLAKPRTTIPSQPLTPKLATMLAVKRFRICSLILQQLGSTVPRNRFPTDSKGGRLEIYSEGVSGWGRRGNTELSLSDIRCSDWKSRLEATPIFVCWYDKQCCACAAHGW